MPPGAAAQHILQMGTGYIVSAALHAATTLGIADHLAAGSMTTADLAKAVGANEDALYRILRALAMVGIFAETGPRTFGLTPAATVLRSGVPGSVRELVTWLCDPFHFRVYAETLHSVKTGEPAGDRVVGMPVFEYLAKEPALSASFNNAMTAFSASLGHAVLEAYDFSGIGTVVDVAGGHGMLIASILQKCPGMQGILFDVDHVIAGARLGELGVKDRCRTASGDFFTAVPAGGDAYVLKHVIHDWDDDRAATILRNVRTALEGVPNGRVILVESVITPGNDPDFAKLLDLEMLVLPGGRERTAEDFRALFTRSGFHLTQIVPTTSPVSVIEARLSR